MTPSDLQACWEPLEARVGAPDDDPCTAERLFGSYRTLPSSERDSFARATLLELTRRRRFGVTLFLCSHFEEPCRIDDLAEALSELPPPLLDDEEAHLSELIRLLGVAGEPHHLVPVRRYLLERPIGPGWEGVPWCLWPRMPELFAQAWTRFFIEVPPKDWKDGEVVRAFLAEPEAVRTLRRTFHGANYRRWHVLRRSVHRVVDDVNWLGSEERRKLIASLD